MKNQYLDSGIGRTIKIQGKEFLYFSGTSYLGIAQDKAFLNTLADNLFLFGANHGQSRINNIRLNVFDDFENHFAQKAGSETAAVFSSGFLAGIAAWKYLCKNVDEILVAPDAHAAIVPDDISPSIQFNFTQWKNHCLKQAEDLSPRHFLIIANAVDPLSCEIHDFSWAKRIAQKHEVSLLLDDSHAFGACGNSIYGTFQKWADPTINLLVSGSLGKGLGLPAGIILGGEKHINRIKSTSLFGGASPGSPAHLKTFMDMENLYLKKKRWLEDATGVFAQKTATIPQISGSRNFPVFVYSDSSWVYEFEKAGIVTSSFPYPTPKSPSVNRIVISAFHELEDLMYLTQKIQDLSRS